MWVLDFWLRDLSLRSRLFLLLCGLCASIAFAHPHVFVDATVKALFDEKGFTGIQNHWVYDEIYSSATIASADRNGDGKFSSEELGILKSIVFSEAVKNNYFNYIQLGSNFLKADPVQNFKASVKQGRLILDFVVGFSIPAGSDYIMLVIVVADPSNYIQVTTDMEKADVSAPENLDVEYFSDSLEGLSLFKAFLPYVEGLYLRYKKK